MLSILKKIFTPTKNEYTDIFERARYLLSYRITLFLVITLSILLVLLFFFFNEHNIWITLVGFLIAVALFLYVKLTGKYKTFILFYNIIGAALCIFTLYYVNEQPRIVDSLWMVVSSMLSFLTLGRKWGTIIISAHTIALTIFYIFFFNEQILVMKALSQMQINSFGFNIFICFAIIYYLNWQNIKTNKEAEDQLNEAKQFLENQFELINTQNDEKTVLLKEVHHRVKNNLQVIVSLLRLQTRDITDKKELKKFNESINRVLAMALIHEKIYQTEDFSKIDLKDYFSTLANDMIRSFQVEKPIKFNIQCTVVDFGLKPIVPVALIFNELLSNSIKYAFNTTDTPEINVILREISDDKIEFEYSDNGNWKIPERENTFGLELIETLTEQLNGHFEFTSEKQTKYHFYFEKINA
ncbi:MAG: sensor histidine kinase [Flavobacteriia bacterium]|jgi:two-component sensor histidine kinase